MICYAKLALPIGIKEIQKETQQLLQENDWMPHFNTYDYEGNWEVLPLRSPGGKADNPFADLMAQQACFPFFVRKFDIPVSFYK